MQQRHRHRPLRYAILINVVANFEVLISTMDPIDITRSLIVDANIACSVDDNAQEP